MTGTGLRRTVILAFCAGFSCLMAIMLRSATAGPIKEIDFGGVYYGARCAFEHRDPYLFLGRCEAEGGEFPRGIAKASEVGPLVGWREVYPPTALLVVAPLALAPLPAAEIAWIFLTAGLLTLAALSIWDLCSEMPVLAGCFAGFMLLNCGVLLVVGNAGGASVALCVIAAWCFLKDRFGIVGVVLLALSTAIKPQDAGLVWLYFLLAGGVMRKRALQTLGATAVLGLCAALWIDSLAPHWVRELNQNLAALSTRGNINDPGPTGRSARGNFNPIVSAQASASVLKDDPNFYNSVSYGIAGALILMWAAGVVRKPFRREGALLALAAISPLTLVAIYHRPYDARLLLLAIPGCAVLWAGKGAERWIALGLTGASIFLTSDIPLILLVKFAEGLRVSSANWAGKLELLALQPAPLVLLAAGCFYLWVYIRYEPPSPDSAREGAAEKWVGAAVAE